MYQDPCYLSEHNEVWDPPRRVLQSISGIELVEMAHNKKGYLCCGGGGGRMWLEVDKEDKIERIRLMEALATGADLIAVSCPWCYPMLKNAVLDMGKEEEIKVTDVAQLLGNAT